MNLNISETIQVVAINYFSRIIHYKIGLQKRNNLIFLSISINLNNYLSMSKPICQ